MTGKVHAEVEVWSIVQKFIKVEGGRKGRGWGESVEQGKQRKRRGKAKDNEIDEEVGDVEEDIVDVGLSKSEITSNEPQLSATEPGEIVQVVHKIDSFESNASKYILFSAVGFVFACYFSLWLPMTLTLISQRNCHFYISLPFGGHTANFNHPTFRFREACARFRHRK
jgi:hypothetical protein